MEFSCVEHCCNCIKNYFVYVEKNVNLWSPCALYYYDREAKRLTELYTWDDEKVVGIRMISADRLHALGQP